MRLSAPSASPPPRSLLPILAATAAAVFVEIGACATPDSADTHLHPQRRSIRRARDRQRLREFSSTCSLGPPATCCTNADGGALTGNDLADCLYGYGACASLVTTTDSAGNQVVSCSNSYGTGGTGGSSSGADGGASDGG